MRINKPCYVMATNENNQAEITMYGEIVETRPVNWWTDEEVPGDYIVQSEFLEDLDTVANSGANSITLRMNSVGGDAGVSILIHNKLRELAAKGVGLTCIVDGVAMSGGSLIMCAADNVIVNSSSIVMIHKCWSLVYGGYNADELRSMAKQNDAWDKAQISIYSRKTGLSETVLSHMMSETSYMTGKEAIEKGFANELASSEVTVAASADRNSFIVNGHHLSLAKGMKVPDNIPTVSASVQAGMNKKPTPKMGEQIRGGKSMATNLEELRVENAPLAAQVESDLRAELAAENTNAANQAAEAERQRLSEIDSIAHLFDAETVREAKYGENPCSAQEMAYRAATAAATSGNAFMANALEDSKTSNANKVGAAASNPGTGEKTEDVKAAAKQDVAAFRKIREAK